MSTYSEKHIKIRRQLIGFATFLLIMAMIAPLVITEKSAQDESTRVMQTIHLDEPRRDNKESDDDISEANTNTTQTQRGKQETRQLETSRTEEKTLERKPFDKKQAEVKAESKLATTNQTDVSNKSNANTKTSAKAKTAVVKAAPAKITPAKTEANVKSSSAGKKFMIQLVALKNKQRIDELVALLLLNNYNVQMEPKNPKPDEIIRLKLGYYTQREQAERVIRELKKLTKLEGKILTY